MSQYRVWCPDRGETFADCIVYPCDDARYAAEQWAQLDAGFDGDPFTQIECIVQRRVGDGWGEPIVFIVMVESEPVFTARAKMRSKS